MSSFQQQQQKGSAHAPRPCAAGCSFFGSPATLDMCSVCYKKHCAVANGAGPAANPAAAASRSAVAAAVVIGTTVSSTAAKPFAPAAKEYTAAGVAEPAAVPSSSAAKKVQPTRCAACYKKVGLTGFVCRCSKTFCGTHRHAEEHGCSFDFKQWRTQGPASLGNCPCCALHKSSGSATDFKGAGRDAIARNNPLIKGDKLTGKI